MANYVDPMLTQVAKGYRPLGHINEQIMKPLFVKKDSGKIGVYGADGLRIVSSVKAPEGETPTFRMDVSIADAYQLVDHALKTLASDSDKENQDRPFDTERDRAEVVTDLLSTGREYALATTMADTAIITQNTTLSGTGQWGGSADDPLGDIETAVNIVADAIGIDVNMVSLVMSKVVFRRLIILPEIRDTIGANYGLGFKRVTPEMLAMALGVHQVLIGNAYYNSAEVGQTDVLAQIWGKHCWAVYIPVRPKIKELCFGYTVKKKSGIWVDKWYSKDLKGTWVRANDSFDQYLMSAAAAYLIKNAVA